MDKMEQNDKPYEATEDFKLELTDEQLEAVAGGTDPRSFLNAQLADKLAEEAIRTSKHTRPRPQSNLDNWNAAK